MLESLVPILWVAIATALGALLMGGVVLINLKWFPRNVYGTPKKLRRRTYPVNKPNPKLKTVVIRCFDRRFSLAHRLFLWLELKLRGKDYYPIKFAGGPAALARQNQMPAKYAAIMEDLDLAMEHHPIELALLFAHQDCRRYDRLVDRTTSDPHVEKLDLLKAIQVLREKYPNVKVRGFYARFVVTRWRKKRRIVFDEVLAQEAVAQETAAA